MLDAILEIARTEGATLIVANPAVPNQHNEEAIRLTADSMVSSAAKLMQEGGLPALLSAIQDPDRASSVVGKLASDLMERCGVESSAATSIASELLPRVIRSVMAKVADPADTTFTPGNLLNLVMSRLGAGSSPLTNAITTARESGSGAGAENDSLGALGALMGAMGSDLSKTK
jgi:hypothetical protein